MKWICVGAMQIVKIVAATNDHYFGWYWYHVPTKDAPFQDPATAEFVPVGDKDMRAAIESKSKDEDLENDAVSYLNKVQKKLIQLKLKLCSINHTFVLNLCSINHAFVL